MRRALEYARATGLPIIGHEEDPTLKGDGVMNEGFTATRLGLRGLPGAAESVMCRRDADLAELTDGRVHLAHLSVVQSFDALRDAKRRGLRVTGETCPHYWVLTDEAVGDYDTNAKMNPPLRSEADRAACIEAIVDGTIDCFATDHAPHTADEKAKPFTDAPFGIVGLETALALTITYLVEPGHLSLARAIELWTDAPRRIFRLPDVTLEPGSQADLVLFDPGGDVDRRSGTIPYPGAQHPVRGLDPQGPSARDHARRSIHPRRGRRRIRTPRRDHGVRTMKRREAMLALEDGRVFRGLGFGAETETTGEVVFNTAMTGYQEVLSDPSYCGQILTFTYPLIGNYGVNDEDFESAGLRAQGMVCRDLCEVPSNWRSTGTLDALLREQGPAGYLRRGHACAHASSARSRHHARLPLDRVRERRRTHREGPQEPAHGGPRARRCRHLR
jgi:hypothetical protein